MNKNYDIQEFSISYDNKAIHFAAIGSENKSYVVTLWIGLRK